MSSARILGIVVVAALLGCGGLGLFTAAVVLPWFTECGGACDHAEHE